MGTLLMVCGGILFLCIVALIKNEIAWKIQQEYIQEVYENLTDGDKSLDWKDIPHYLSTFSNPFIWKYKPLKKVKEGK